MPRYTREYSVVHVFGTIWMPAANCAMDYTLSSYDLENIMDGKPFAEITRDDIADWLSTHAGDFQHIIDFEAFLSSGGEDVEIPWETEEGEIGYSDAMFPAEEFEE